MDTLAQDNTMNRGKGHPSAAIPIVAPGTDILQNAANGIVTPDIMTPIQVVKDIDCIEPATPVPYISKEMDAPEANTSRSETKTELVKIDSIKSEPVGVGSLEIELSSSTKVEISKPDVPKLWSQLFSHSKPDLPEEEALGKDKAHTKPAPANALAIILSSKYIPPSTKDPVFLGSILPSEDILPSGDTLPSEDILLPRDILPSEEIASATSAEEFADGMGRFQTSHPVDSGASEPAIDDFWLYNDFDEIEEELATVSGTIRAQHDNAIKYRFLEKKEPQGTKLVIHKEPVEFKPSAQAQAELEELCINRDVRTYYDEYSNNFFGGGLESSEPAPSIPMPPRVLSPQSLIRHPSQDYEQWILEQPNHEHNSQPPLHRSGSSLQHLQFQKPQQFSPQLHYLQPSRSIQPQQLSQRPPSLQYSSIPAAPPLQHQRSRRHPHHQYQQLQMSQPPQYQQHPPYPQRPYYFHNYPPQKLKVQIDLTNKPGNTPGDAFKTRLPPQPPTPGPHLQLSSQTLSAVGQNNFRQENLPPVDPNNIITTFEFWLGDPLDPPVITGEWERLTIAAPGEMTVVSLFDDYYSKSEHHLLNKTPGEEQDLNFYRLNIRQNGQIWVHEKFSYRIAKQNGKMIQDTAWYTGQRVLVVGGDRWRAFQSTYGEVHYRRN